MSFLQNLLNVILTKYLKQEVDDDLSVSVDERSPYGLSKTGDIKIYVSWSKGNDVTAPPPPQWRSVLSTSITESLLLPKFSKSSPSVFRDTQWSASNDAYLLFKFDVSSFSVTLDIEIFTGHFADFEQFKVIYFANYGQVRIDPLFFTDSGQVSYFTEFG